MYSDCRVTPGNRRFTCSTVNQLHWSTIGFINSLLDPIDTNWLLRPLKKHQILKQACPDWLQIARPSSRNNQDQIERPLVERPQLCDPINPARLLLLHKGRNDMAYSDHSKAPVGSVGSILHPDIAIGDTSLASLLQSF